VTHAIATLAGETTEAPIDAEAARADQRRAQDALDAAVATRDEIERRATDVARSLPLARMAVNDAANAVVWSESRAARAALVAEITAIQTDLVDACRTLGLMLSAGPRPMPEQEDVSVAAARVLDIAPFRWLAASGGPTMPTEARWRAAREALLHDPAAVLPGNGR
jgi:hypothetical protein